MTEQEYQALDARVALAIFGEEWPLEWLFLEEEEDGYGGDLWCAVGIRGGKGESALAPESARRRINDQLPRYSSSIKAAWEIVEHIRALGWQWEINLYGDGSCAIRLEHTRKWSPYEAFDDFCIGVCRTALAWAECTKQ